MNEPDMATAMLDQHLDEEELADRQEEEFDTILDDCIAEISDDASMDDEFVQELVANHPEAVRAWATNHRKSIMQLYGDGE